MFEELFFPPTTDIIETPVSPLRLAITFHTDRSGRHKHV